jgi:hypothetical protein
MTLFSKKCVKLKLRFILDIIYGFRRRSDPQKLKDADFGFWDFLRFLLADGKSLKSQQQRNQCEDKDKEI